MMRRRAYSILLHGALCLASLGKFGHVAWAGSSEQSSKESSRQQYFTQALEIRNSTEASGKKHALLEVAVLLQAAAGLRSREPSSPSPLLPTTPRSIAAAVAGALSPGYDPETAELLSGFESSLVVDKLGIPAALRELAKAYEEGQGVAQHMQLSLELLRCASDRGDAEAQGLMAMRYALGLHHTDSWDASGIVQFGQPDSAAAVLHYYFGALGGDAFARMALGYRHLYGLGVPRSCWSAAKYYQAVAEQVADLSTQPDMLPQIERIRLHVQATKGTKADRHKEVVEYYQYSADRGNIDAQTAVGQVLNFGTHGIQRDHARAVHYLQRAAESGDIDAMAHLGHMSANGFGTPKDAATAAEYFLRAARENNPSAQFGLGYMLLTGHGMAVDYDKAFKYLSQAAEQGQADAHFYLGVMHLKGLGLRRKSVQRAFSYFSLAASAGHILSMYNLAIMHLAGKGTVRACKPAVQQLKTLSERAPIAAVLQRGHEQFFRGSYSSALLHYLAASELGSELGQSNAAWMLSRGYVVSDGLHESSSPSAVSAFQLYQRSAEQGNVHSLLQLGDAYFYGRGTKQDWVRSAAVYYEAYQDRSAEAMFNLGFMHEFGAGVPQDLTLARKFFNMAVHTQPDAYSAVGLAKTWLSAHETWLWIRPYLPAYLQHLTRSALVLEPPHTNVFGSWVHAALSSALMPSQLLVHMDMLVGRWADAMGLSHLAGWADSEAGDMGETIALLGLMLVLYFVLKIRSRRRAAIQQVPPPVGGDQPPQ